MLILLVGLQGIPEEVYEAAALDGASALADLPQDHVAAAAAVAGPGADPVHHRLAARLRPVLHPDQRRAGQQHVTVVQLIYREAFQRQNLGTAAALSIIVLRSLLVVNAAQFRGLRVGRGAEPCDAHAGMLGRTPYYVLTGGLAIIFLFPLLWSAVASVSPQAATGQVIGYGPRQLHDAAELSGRPRSVRPEQRRSSSLLTVALTLAVSLLGGYAFARFPFPGQNVLFLLTLAILMVPYATLLIPLYVLLNSLGLQDSLLGVSLVLAMFQLPFATFMMRISFEAVPRELEESALVDGCGTFARPAADPAAGRRAGPHHGRPVRLPGRLERLLRAADPDHRQRQGARCRWRSRTSASRRWAPSTTAPPRPAWSSWPCPAWCCSCCCSATTCAASCPAR